MAKYKLIDVTNIASVDNDSPIGKAFSAIDQNFIDIESQITSLAANVANVKPTTTTTAPATTGGPVAVGGAVNPMASPVGTTTAMKGYVAAYCNAGVMLTLDNIKVGVTTSGSRGLCMSTVTGTMTASISGYYTYSYSGMAGTATTYPGPSYSTTPSTSFFGWSFGNAGDTSIYHIHDYTNQKMYRVTLMIGASYMANFISIERLI